MKVFISSDMEGTAGVVDWEHVQDHGARYEYFTELLTAEINAAIEGALRAGATEFLVNDSHSKMVNLRPDALAGEARYLSGRYKPMYMMEGLDGSFDAAFFISYHGSMGSDASTLSHTYSPAAIGEVTINGIVAGEAGINSLVALAYGVPVVLVTGDATTAEETAAFCPGVQRVVVKESVSRFAANSLHPERARALITEAACLAIASLPSAKQVAIELPATVEVRFKSSDYAQLASRIAGCERTGVLGAQLVGDDALELYRTFISIVLLCRGLRE